jgi:hypothetical protein
MAPLKQKGDLAEMMVAADLIRRGYSIAIPFGEDCDFDLVLCRHDRLERVQVKYTESDGTVIAVRCRSHGCYYIPASELADGMHMMHLRLKPARNNQQKRIRQAPWYADLRDDQPAA